MRANAGWIAVALLPWVAAAGGSNKVRHRTWIVDDDARQCRHPDFTTIQGAVNAASPGDTIHVCPGTYAESVTVATNSLFLEGASADCDRRTGNPQKEAVVRPFPANSSAFTVTGRGDVLSQFTIVGDGSLVSLNGVRTQGSASRIGIQQNAIWGFSNGISLGTDASPFDGWVSENVLKDNDIGLFTDELLGLSVENNRLKNNRGGMYLQDSKQFDVARNTIDSNVYNSVAIQTVNVDLSTFRKNWVKRSGLEGMFLEDGERISVNDNVVENVASGFGIRIGNCSDSEARRNKLENINTSASFPNTGLVIFNSRGVTVEDNSVSRVNGSGISVEFLSTDIDVRENNSHHNTVDGIVNSASSANRFIENKSFGNGRFDANDSDRASNLWRRNWCRTDNPPGTICPH